MLAEKRKTVAGYENQLSLFPDTEETQKHKSASTFSDNLALPIHRWFRYSAGFSALWVKELIEREKSQGRSRALDPLCGSGTVLLEAERCQIESFGVEAHPFIARVAQAKLHWREDPKAFRKFALDVLDDAKAQESNEYNYPALINKCFPTLTLMRLDALRKAWAHAADGSPVSELTWLVLASILRECSPVGTAQWQYILPNKTKARVQDPYEAFAAKVHLMGQDMAKRQRLPHGPAAALLAADARQRLAVPDRWADLVITSPPYANNYDYADATRLEMSFFGDVAGWGDLQATVRRHLVRSCTQHVAKLASTTYQMAEETLLEPIRRELLPVCRHLDEAKESHGGKKPYHAMIAAYFSDMAKVWANLRRVTCTDCLICFVVGDSAPYGVYVPVDRWLGELAVAAGFKSYYFEKTRDRNIKWKNRKHRVPLHEGRLWVQG